MTTPDKLKELKDIVIGFNEYLQTVSIGLEQLDTGVKAIVTLITSESELTSSLKELTKSSSI